MSIQLKKTRFYPPIPSSEITPEDIFHSRRQFMKSIVGLGASAIVISACAPAVKTSVPPTLSPTNADLSTQLTPEKDAESFNNYYEFSLSKDGVAAAASHFQTEPWTVEISGMINQPMKIGIADLVKRYPPEERVYRHRCVEAWAMVVPWLGIPLNRIIKDLEPASEAKFIKLTTLYDPNQMPGQKASEYPYPYTEGLRLDEAMNDLVLLSTGLYGKPLLPQNGAPLRLVVPWKYGFKSIKSIVKIELTDQQPATFWNTLSPQEYGFYANVNPAVPHPRWSQARETLIGTAQVRDTQLFNGYADQVAALYSGLDLSINY